MFLPNAAFKLLISFIMKIKFREVDFYFRRDHHYFIYFNLMHLVSFQVGRVKKYIYIYIYIYIGENTGNFFGQW